MQDIQLIGTIMVVLTIVYTLPIAALHNVPNNRSNRLLCIFLPHIVILACLMMLLLQIYYFMEHEKSTGVYIAFFVVALQIGFVFSSMLNYWGLSEKEIIARATADSNTTLNPSFSLLLNAGFIHLISLFLGLSVLTVE